MKFVTIGAYGFTEESFFRTLQIFKVDTFCDIRQRRGIRGATYAFANSRRLQEQLSQLGIRYFHFQDLAPTKAIRERQRLADKANKIAKRQRNALDPAFVEAYLDEVLGTFDLQLMLEKIGPESKVVALFCVEREPTACHRSLVADRLKCNFGLTVEHIYP